MVNNEGKIPDQIKIYPLLVVLICGALSYWVISPKISTLRDFNTKISAKEKDTVALQEKIDNLKILQKQFTSSPADVELLNLAITEDSQIPEIIEQILAISNKSGMIVKSIRPDYRQTTGETIINITARGDYPNLIGLISGLEKNLRLTSVKSINMNSVTTQTSNVLDTTLAIGFFTLSSATSSISQSNSNVGE